MATRRKQLGLEVQDLGSRFRPSGFWFRGAWAFSGLGLLRIRGLLAVVAERRLLRMKV